MTQRGIAVRDSRRHVRRAIPVLNTGTVDYEANEQSDGIGHDMAFAPLYPFTCVIASNPATFRCFYAPTVDDPRCWPGLATLSRSRASDELTVYLIQQAIPAP